MPDIKILLLSVSATVDQLGAEFKDPETEPARKEEIREQLSQLYHDLQKYSK